MKNIFLLCVLILCGCDNLFQPQDPIIVPDQYDEPESRPSVILVSEPWCAACQEQKEILRELYNAGEISEYQIVSSKHPSYKSRVLPTLYVCSNGGCKRLEGLSSGQDIARAAQGF